MAWSIFWILTEILVSWLLDNINIVGNTMWQENNDEASSVIAELERRVLKAELALREKEEENAALKQQLQQYERRWSEYEGKMKSMEETWQNQLNSLQVNFYFNSFLFPAIPLKSESPSSIKKCFYFPRILNPYLQLLLFFILLGSVWLEQRMGMVRNIPFTSSNTMVFVKSSFRIYQQKKYHHPLDRNSMGMGKIAMSIFYP